MHELSEFNVSAQVAIIFLMSALGGDLKWSTLDFAAQMAAVSQYSLRGMKKFIRRIMDGQVDDDADTATIFTDAHDSDDHHEGLKAFMEKRKPDFTWNG